MERIREELTKTNLDHTVLIMSRHPPHLYGPAWERVRHLALASGSIFGNTFVLTLCSNAKGATKNVGPRVLLHEVRLTRELPYPINAYFDPVKFILLFVHGFLLSLRYRPSHILASMPPSEVGVSAWLVAKFLGINLVIDLRDDWESAVGWGLSSYIPAELLKVVFWLARKVYSFATAILVATQTIAERVEKRGIETPLIVVSNGADTSVFFPQDGDTRKNIRMRCALPQNKVIMVYCGSGINPYYRLDKILSAVSSLSNDVKKHLFIVFYLYNGIEKVKGMKEKLSISDDLVVVREPVSRSVLAEIMAACDVGLVPFDDEPYLLCARSAKLYEYLSAGLYVIGSGPKGGELHRLFSLNPELGRFSLPYLKNFLDVFSWVIKRGVYIFDDNNRFLRHEFIRENYERKTIMIRAMREIRSISTLALAK